MLKKTAPSVHGDFLWMIETWRSSFFMLFDMFQGLLNECHYFKTTDLKNTLNVFQYIKTQRVMLTSNESESVI